MKNSHSSFQSKFSWAAGRLLNRIQALVSVSLSSVTVGQDQLGLAARTEGRRAVGCVDDVDAMRRLSLRKRRHGFFNFFLRYSYSNSVVR